MRYKNYDISSDAKEFLVQVFNSKEFGASKTFLFIARQLKLDQIIFSRKTQWREDVLAMLAGKLIFPSNDFLLGSFQTDTVLWECCGHSFNKKLDISINGYQPLAELLSRQSTIQKKLVDKHLGARFAVLYDLTSWDQPLGPDELHVGLLTNAEGCPLGIEFFSDHLEGGIQNQIKILLEKLKLKSLILLTDFQKLISKETKAIKILAQPQLYEIVNAKNRLMTPDELTNIIKQIMHIKRTFKDVMVDGVFHSNHRANAFLTMLSFYLKWHIVQKLDSYFKINENSHIRSWSFSDIIERLKSIRSQKIQIGDVILDDIKSNLDVEQSEILTAFGLNSEILFSRSEPGNCS